MNRPCVPRGSRVFARKAIAALAALLTACSNARVETMNPARQAEVAGHGDSIVLMRFAGQRGGKPFNPLADIDGNAGPRVVFRNLDTEATYRSPTDLHFPAPSEDAAKAGWAYFPLPGGSYYLALNTSLRDLGTPGQGLRFDVPATSSVVYIGTFSISCAGDAAPSASGPCDAQARIDDESAEAAEVAAKSLPGIGTFAVGLAVAYDAQSGGERLQSSAAPDIAFDRATWRLRREQDEPPPKPSSSSPSYSSGGGWGGGNPLSGCGGPGCGALLLTILLVAGTIYAVDQIDKALAEPERKPCTDALSESVTIDKLKPLLTGFTFSADARPAAEGAPDHWEASVSRVLLRKCSMGDTYAVEVAAHWRGIETRTGRASFDAVLVSAPQSPASDKRVAHPWDRNSPLPPWELRIPVASMCRPLAEYCASDSSDIVLRDIANALQGMRAWLIDHPASPPGTSATGAPPVRRLSSSLQ